MKRFTLCFMLMAAGLFSIQAQTLVSTDTLLRNVVLEEYTGIHCQYCPDGHARAQAISDANPGRVVLVNIHQGGYATPSGSDPDYRTAFGDALAGQIALTGYPAGTVNRHVFPGLEMTAGGTGMGRGDWADAAGQILELVSPVNVGLSSSFDSATRLLTVTVEVYYTADSPQSTNYINVAFLENGIIGPQQVLTTWNTSYTHNHMLRHFLTGQWGDTLTATTAGEYTQRVYTYTVPAGFNVANCDVAAYVTQSHQEIYTGAQVVADGGTTLIVAEVGEPDPDVEIGTVSDTTRFALGVTSALPGFEDFAFELTADAPSDWDAYFDFEGTLFSGQDTLTLTTAWGDLDIVVVPGATPGVGSFTLKVSSVSNPLAPPLYRKVVVISDVTDLVVNNDAPWGDGGSTYSAEYFEGNYLKGLAHAGNTHYASTSSSLFLQIAEAGKLTGVGHVYYNIGWSFPSFNDKIIAALEDFLDAGGNLFVSGQDIGWDTWDLTNGGNGTPASQAFYTNYLNAEFLNDGGSTNNIMTPLTSDLVFYDLDTSSIVNVYGGAYFYPDQIDTTGYSLPIFYYNSNLAKMGGLRATNNTWKVVYIGISLEMISDTNIRKEMIRISHDWFHGSITGAEEIEAAFSGIYLGQNYPNPSDQWTEIPLSGLQDDAVLRVYSLSGKLVFSSVVGASQTRIMIRTADWDQGIYFYHLLSNEVLTESKKIIISR